MQHKKKTDICVMCYLNHHDKSMGLVETSTSGRCRPSLTLTFTRNF